MHVLDPLLAAAAQMRHIDLVSDTREELRDFCRGIPLGEVGAPGAACVSGPAAQAICDTAAALGADLIVAGSRGLSGLNRLMMGTTVEHVIRRAHISVLTVPGRCPAAGGAEWGPVIAAVEDPGHPEPIARAAADVWPTALDAPLHLVHVVPPLPALARWQAEADAVHARADRRGAAHARGRHVAGWTASAGQRARCGGTVADALAAEAGRHTGSMPMLVLGRAMPGHGHGAGHSGNAA